MPEYLAPGVFVEEVSFRSKSIEGVSTTTTGFVGPTRYGPVEVEPEVITSLAQYERIFGDSQQLLYGSDDPAARPEPPMHNYMWHAARAFFEEGGKRLYVARTFRPIRTEEDADATHPVNDGHAFDWVSPDDANGDPTIRELRVLARHPGEAGRMRVRLTLRMSANILSSEPSPEPNGQPRSTAKALIENDIVWISDISSPLGEEESRTGRFYRAERVEDLTSPEPNWRFVGVATSSGQIAGAGAAEQRDLQSLRSDFDPRATDEIRIVTLTVTTLPLDSDIVPQVWDGLSLDPDHKRAGEPDSAFSKFAQDPGSPALRRRIPIVFDRQPDNITGVVIIEDGLEFLDLLLRSNANLGAALDDLGSTDGARSIELLLEGGNDGQRPEAPQYEGRADLDSSVSTGLRGFEAIEDISIVAAPGSTFGYENGYRVNGATILNHLVSHAERMRYRIAVLDSGDGQTVADVRDMRGRLDSKYAAFYYPWVRVLDPVTRQEIHLPPSGFVAGIYARNDVNRAVYKAPANEVVNLAIGFEQLLSKGQQEVLNPEGINCFRFFEGRGFRLWGARTISSDPEWKYVNLRRYFAYLERSIDKGTQWAVFEPNGYALWANVRRTIEDFLLNEFQMGALLGEKPEQAYFVKCDRSTMTQNDLDNGRLVCLVGVAALKPAEFVIFRIGQWTSDRKS